MSLICFNYCESSCRCSVQREKKHVLMVDFFIYAGDNRHRFFFFYHVDDCGGGRGDEKQYGADSHRRVSIEKVFVDDEKKKNYKETLWSSRRFFLCHFKLARADQMFLFLVKRVALQLSFDGGAVLHRRHHHWRLKCFSYPSSSYPFQGLIYFPPAAAAASIINHFFSLFKLNRPVSFIVITSRRCIIKNILLLFYKRQPTARWLDHPC